MAKEDRERRSISREKAHRLTGVRREVDVVDCSERNGWAGFSSVDGAAPLFDWFAKHESSDEVREPAPCRGREDPPGIFCPCRASASRIPVAPYGRHPRRRQDEGDRGCAAEGRLGGECAHAVEDDHSLPGEHGVCRTDHGERVVPKHRAEWRVLWSTSIGHLAEQLNELLLGSPIERSEGRAGRVGDPADRR